MNQYTPVIVVVAFNRPSSLKRLLSSLKAGKKISSAKLIISIDNQEPDNLIVKEVAETYIWPFGEKEVIYQKQRLGLRKHVLQCGDYASTYGSVIILEDDLFVSPFFYDYAVKALSYYDNEEQIGGISLYNQPYEEISHKPFTTVNDGSDVYFLQFPSSLGQAWTKKQWEHFRNWYETNPDLSELNLPDKVYDWPETSWKKYFCAFLVKMNRYFVFPKISMTTNFNDPGTNLKMLVNHDGQTKLNIFDLEYRFINFERSYCVYDVYFELKSDSIKLFNPDLNKYSFETDLYGRRNIQKVKMPYILTSRPVKNAILGYQRALKPHEMNVILNLSGKDIFLCKTENVRPINNITARIILDYQYYFHRRLPSFKVLLYNFYIRRLCKYFEFLRLYLSI